MYNRNQKREIEMLIKNFYQHHNMKSKTFNEKNNNNILKKS